MLSIGNKVLLASKSPRRKELLRLACLDFRSVTVNIDEEGHPKDMPAEQVPLFLAEEKAKSVEHLRQQGEILISADTLVFLDGKIISKPADKQEAYNMLSELSGKMHTVISGVCIISDFRKELISDETNVYFRAFDLREMEFYISNFEVTDKAGAYGAQDWIGLVGIERIEGSYFNVMGLPIHKVYDHLKFLENHL